MKNSKQKLLLSLAPFILLAALPAALAQSVSDPFSFLRQVLEGAMKFIISIFQIGFLDGQSDYVAFMRLMIFIITLTLFHAILQFVGTQQWSRLMSAHPSGKKVPLIISLCLAIITAVFMPESVLLAIGIQYSAVWSAILLGAVFAAMLYAYFRIRANGPMGHLLRLVVLFLCWMLLFNMTAITEQPIYQPGSEFTSDYPAFQNPVLNMLWSILNAIVGILLLVELFRLVQAISRAVGAGGGAVGGGGAAGGGPAVNLGGGNNPGSGGSGGGGGGAGGNAPINMPPNSPPPAVVEQELKEAEKPLEEAEKIAKKEETAVKEISRDEDREATADDRAMKFSRTLHKMIQNAIEYLTILIRMVQERRADPKTFESNLKSLIDRLNSTSNTMRSHYNSEEWAYSLVTKELKTAENLHLIIRGQNNLISDVGNRISKLPNSELKTVLAAKQHKIADDIRKFDDDVRQLVENCKSRAQQIYIALKTAQKELTDLQSVSNMAQALKSNPPDVAAKLDSARKHLHQLLESLKQEDEFTSVFYTMTRDSRAGIIQKVNEDISKIQRDIEVLERDLDDKEKKLADMAKSRKPRGGRSAGQANNALPNSAYGMTRL